ncbi:hypothetical protein Tco_0374481 [Tanacetum coccineum]
MGGKPSVGRQTLQPGGWEVADGIFLLVFSFKALARVMLGRGTLYFTISSLQFDLKSWKLNGGGVWVLSGWRCWDDNGDGVGVYSESGTSRPKFSSNRFKRLSEIEANLLEVEFEENEVWEAVKVDFEKAYDCVNWEFLYEVTSQMGFRGSGAVGFVHVLRRLLLLSLSTEKALSSYGVGGLNIDSLKAMNWALLSKWWWRFQVENEALWVKVGDGKAILFWDDTWVGGRRLRDQFPRWKISDDGKFSVNIRRDLIDEKDLRVEAKISIRYSMDVLNLSDINSFNVAYTLELPKELSNVHNTFHVSNLKKCLSDESLVIPMKELRLHHKLNFVEEPVEIVDREVKQLRQSRIPIVKVRWNSKSRPEFTWEREDQIRAKYPRLFPNITPASN